MSKEISSKIKLAFEESINLKKIILKDELFTVLEKCGSLICLVKQSYNLTCFNKKQILVNFGPGCMLAMERFLFPLASMQA